MISKNKALGTISPDFDGSLFNVQTGGADILFDWTPMLIPNGTCMIKSVSGTIMGTNGAADNREDFRLYFAKSINGIAPAAFGTPHGTIDVNAPATFRRNILGALYVDMTTTDDANLLVAYNVFQSKIANAGSTTGELRQDILLQGEPNITTQGYQTIYVAAKAAGVFDFGTDVDLNMAASADVDEDMTGASVQLTVTGTDPRLVFQAGDSIVGETGTVEMEVVSVDGATTMTVKNITDTIDHAEQLIHKNPIALNFGLEY